MSGPSVRTGAPTCRASSTISTARSTPKQNPYSLAKRTSITRFPELFLIPSRQTIHQPKRASRLRPATRPIRLYDTAQPASLENHFSLFYGALQSSDYPHRLTTSLVHPARDKYLPWSCDRSCRMTLISTQRQYLPKCGAFPSLPAGRGRRTSCPARDTYHLCR